MINISIDNMEMMNAGALMRVAGLFQAIAQYSHAVEIQQQEQAEKQKAEAAKAEAQLNPVPKSNGLAELDPAHSLGDHLEAGDIQLQSQYESPLSGVPTPDKSGSVPQEPAAGQS